MFATFSTTFWAICLITFAPSKHISFIFCSLVFRLDVVWPASAFNWICLQIFVALICFFLTPKIAFDKGLLVVRWGEYSLLFQIYSNGLDCSVNKRALCVFPWESIFHLHRISHVTMSHLFLWQVCIVVVSLTALCRPACTYFTYRFLSRYQHLYHTSETSLANQSCCLCQI